MTQPENIKGANARLNETEYLKLASSVVVAASVGGPVPVDPDVADAMGAFDEEALSLDDALDSHLDGEDPTAFEEILGNG
ncbi:MULTISPECIES: hypothetical protein [Thalassospira]|uniref:Uncharacterized protein n=1 Tax=Thalassospira profundimaris TaxID=502049 RepID=A0A367X242_9PROT|nr:MULTISPECIES: hypothetical protein [Thalassospira]MEE3046415.1 hypothetical protein [Pseudomonadota bacterium]HAI31611.1 hypothetical protein [Thalassospira sp.]KZC98689.1 hypothetical protein AUQ41_15195 [Thalassospira sp. MCCC 1A02898]ONH86447.1 hypothetical protein TH47_14500 [Thalassospira sp. MCCC 1A02803]RCK47745.1 hypothetical protein TH30_04615 [Thalassospira profundimaris]|tara:strand:- start:187 stop:426 length:240 start_codon:yes stop_codon:yes gene_type:complete